LTSRETLTALGAVLRRDARIFASYRLRPVSVAISPLVAIATFHFISKLVSVPEFPTPAAYFGFVVIGIALSGVLAAVVSGPQDILRQEMVAGTFDRLVVAPAGPICALVGMLIFPALLALVTATLALLYAVVIFGLRLNWPNALLGVPVAAAGILAFASIGLVLQAVVLVVKQAQAGVAWLLAAIALLSGFYFPTSLLPDWLRWTSEVQPFSPTLDLLRYVLVDSPLDDPLALLLLRIVAFTVVTVPVALYAQVLALRITSRTGGIVES